MSKAKIYYFSLTDEMLKEEKLLWFKNNPIQNIPFEKIIPSKKNNWTNLVDNDFEELLPLTDKKDKDILFASSSNGISTNRDAWVFDLSKKNLINKGKYLCKIFNESVNENQLIETIKWSSTLKGNFNRKEKTKFDKSLIIKCNYRPFTEVFFYSDKIFNDRLTQSHYDYFEENLVSENFVINLNGNGKDIRILATNNVSDLHFTGDTKMFPLYHYDSNGNRHDNLTDWGLQQFKTHYQDDSITKESIFHYTYAVLHHPAYRSKYELNLKREFPRLPFYTDFHKWSDIGKTLMDLHLNYETAEPHPVMTASAVKETTKSISPATVMTASAVKETAKQVSSPTPKPKLKADKEAGTITLDDHTTLTGIPDIAWTYKLGNRSALEWILDQYKEKKPRDATIAEKFNTYRFADYKEEVIDLLCRVCTVSVKTMEIINEMPNP